MKARIIKVITFTKRFFSILCITGLILSCSSEGEIGPQGDTGKQGEQGEQGEQGAQGEVGTANVIYSAWIPSGFDANITSPSASFSIPAPLLTGDIKNSGIILVYGRSKPIIITVESTVYALPLTITGTINETYYIRVKLGSIDVAVRTLDGADLGTVFLNNGFRYILIPGGTSAGRSAAAPDYSKMTYEEIVELFDIQD